MTTVADLVANARANIDLLAPSELRRAATEGAVVVDIREAEEIAATGIISGAIHVPRGLLEFRADPTSPVHDHRFEPSRRTILYCASGGRSALAALTLRSLGYADVGHLEGGFGAWKQAGEPVEH